MSVDPEELLGEEEPQEPVAHTRITYTGPVAPHWEITHEGGDETAVDEFRARAMARLQLLPPHDPQFRRNRERVNRDAERELIELVWDLGYEEGEGEGAASLGDKPTPTTPLVGADDIAVTAGEEPTDEAEASADTEASAEAGDEAETAGDEAEAAGDSEDDTDESGEPGEDAAEAGEGDETG